MKKHLLYLIYIISGLTLTACEKEIEIDYHDADMRYVVEAFVSNIETHIRISHTKPMDDNTTDSNISNATVILTAGDTIREVIPYSSNGFYTSSFKGIPGTTYHLDITFGDIRLQDIPNENNYYFVHIFRNGLGYRWAAFKDESNPNKELQQLFGFFREGSNKEEVLHEGDKLRVVVRTIDRGAYDYLKSVGTMDQTGTNPIDNFTGGCLGYFSAHSELIYELIYSSYLIVNDDED